MQLQLIRNATMRIRYGPVLILCDPLLSPKLTMEPYAGRSPNPLVDLPFSVEKILSGVDVVLLSHLHSDHFDGTARQSISKEMLILCQPGDRRALIDAGFQNIHSIEDERTFQGVRIDRTGGSHGMGAVLVEMGEVSGFIFSSAAEPTLYWVGDSVLCDEIYQMIDRYKPDLIITHSSGARWGSSQDLIVMDAEQTIRVAQYASKSTVVAVHMEALDHGTISRAALVAARDSAGLSAGRLLVPRDGETLNFGKGIMSPGR